MSDCQACGATIRPDLEECENCGHPIPPAAKGRRTLLADDGAAPAAGGVGLYRPGAKGGRRTQIGDADPFAPAAPSGAPQARRALDPDDPFAVAAQPARSGSRGGGRRTMIEGAVSAPPRVAVSPDDPFARALDPVQSAPVEAWPALERPLVGLFITYSGAPHGRVLVLTQGRTDIGRDPGPPGPEVLIIDDDSVSAIHAEVTAQPGVIWFQDNRSANGTRIKSVGDDDFRMLPPRVPGPLEDGDIIEMGECTLLFKLIDQAAIKTIWGR